MMDAHAIAVATLRMAPMDQPRLSSACRCASSSTIPLRASQNASTEAQIVSKAPQARPSNGLNCCAVGPIDLFDLGFVGLHKIRCVSCPICYIEVACEQLSQLISA